jgi:hypothetical protein
MRPTPLVVALVLTVSTAIAHDTKGPHGGKIADIGSFHAELATKEKTIEVYLTDPTNKAVPVTGYTGLAILLVGGKSERVQLEPAGEGPSSTRTVRFRSRG